MYQTALLHFILFITFFGNNQLTTQSNKMHYNVPRYFILQYHIEHCYMFRSLMGSSSGNHIKVTQYKTELAIHVHNKEM
jgi:hypothetical protein